MQNINIRTTQNVNIDLPLAGAGRRLLAFSIDSIAIALILILIIFLSEKFLNFDIDNISDASNISWAISMLIILPVILHSLYIEILTQGRSLGKWIVGLKVIKLNGYKPKIQDYFVRWIFRVVDVYFFMIVTVLIKNQEVILGSFALTGIVALIAISISKKGQRIGDIVAGTSVIYTRYTENIDITILENLKKDYQPTFSQVLKLSDNDMRIIKDNYKLATRKQDDQTIKELSEKVKEVTGIESEYTDIKFLDIVVKDFNYYTARV